MGLGDYVLPAVGVAGAVWIMHALKIIDLDPGFLPGVIANRTRNISKQEDRLGSQRNAERSSFAQDTLNTIEGIFMQNAQKRRANPLAQTVGSAGAGVAGPGGHGGL